MNYYEHHIGDYDEATAHLTACEDGIYSRLIRKYMATEKALPADVKTLQRLVRARSKEERDAVETVLSEFFELCDDGWHQHRCDETIARYQDKQTKARRSAEARWSAQRSQSDGNANASADAMRTHSEGNANQTPITNNHKKHKPRAERFDAQARLESFGVPSDLAKDWLAVRKAKKLAPTATAFDDAKAEADKAGISMTEAVRTCCVRGWGGFKASWLNEQSGRVNGHDDSIFG